MEILQGRKGVLQILTAEITNNSAPTIAGDGVSLDGITTQIGGVPRDLLFLMASTAGTDTLTVKLRAWGYNQDAAQWFPMGTSTTVANRGMLNQNTAITEESADQLVHAETLIAAGKFDRIYIQTLSIGGTDTAISCWLIA